MFVSRLSAIIRTVNEMRDTTNLIKTQKQYDKLKSLCARALGTVNKFVDLGLIAVISDGKYKIKVMYRHYYLYEMIYDGERIIQCARLLL